MFDIGFGELLLVMVIGLVVLGPERLPVAVKTVAGWIRALRSLASSVQSELSQELKLQELQDSLKKVEKATLQNMSPELKKSMDELKEAAESMKRSYQIDDLVGKSTPESPAAQRPSPSEPEPEALHDDVTVAAIDSMAAASKPDTGQNADSVSPSHSPNSDR